MSLTGQRQNVSAMDKIQNEWFPGLYLGFSDYLFLNGKMLMNKYKGLYNFTSTAKGTALIFTDFFFFFERIRNAILFSPSKAFPPIN